MHYKYNTFHAFCTASTVFLYGGAVAQEAAAEPQHRVTLRHPGGAFVAHAEVEGSGCGKPGRWADWDVALGADGQTFTITFSGYEVFLDEASRHATRNCILSLHIESARATEYAVTTLYAEPYSYLEAGAEARIRGSSRFVPAPPATELDTTLRGPVDKAFAVLAQPSPEALAWSGCSVTHELEVATELSARSDIAGATGYLNLTAVDGELNTQVRVELAARACP